MFAYLDKLDRIVKMIHHLLIPPRVPPLHSYVVFSSGNDNPERNIPAGQFPNLRVPTFFLRGKMDITFEGGWLNGQVEMLIEERNESVKAMVRKRVAVID